jgi:cold shock CspA family protein
MTSGTIKTIINKDDKQFGFITVEGQAGDTYFSPKGLGAGVDFNSLKMGDKVSFDTMTDPTSGKVSATNVQLVA